MLASASVPFISSAQTNRRRPNVLFVLPDQVRSCDVGCYGGGQNARTPNIDRFGS